VALMLVTIVLAARLVDGLFSAVALIPHPHPTRADIFGTIAVHQRLRDLHLRGAVCAHRQPRRR
jgi:hypothetical protein